VFSKHRNDQELTWTPVYANAMNGPVCGQSELADRERRVAFNSLCRNVVRCFAAVVLGLGVLGVTQAGEWKSVTDSGDVVGPGSIADFGWKVANTASGQTLAEITVDPVDVGNQALRIARFPSSKSGGYDLVTRSGLLN